VFLQTSLYIPFTELEINNLDGQKILYENLVQSGPAYRLVVHESPAWLKIKDEMPWPDMIEVITEQKAQSYKDIVNEFFSPITQVIPSQPVKESEVMQSGANVVMDLRRALSYILIAHDYKARIFEDDILKYSSKLSDGLKQHKNIFPEEAIQRVEFVENLILGYRKDTVSTISVNRDPRIFKDLVNLLSKDEIRILSEKNHLFGIINVKKDVLKMEIKELMTQVVKNEWFPYLVSGSALALSYYSGNIEKVISYLSLVGAKILSKYDFREYAPPVQDPRLFDYASRGDVGSLSYKPFNYEMTLLIPRRK
jgi:hypothetical protein